MPEPWVFFAFGFPILAGLINRWFGKVADNWPTLAKISVIVALVIAWAGGTYWLAAQKTVSIQQAKIEVPGEKASQKPAPVLPYSPPTAPTAKKPRPKSSPAPAVVGTAPADVSKKLAFLDEALALNDEVQALGVPLGTRLKDWPVRINSDREGLLSDLRASVSECAAVEKKFTDFRNRVEIYPDIRKMMDFACYDYGRVISESIARINGLGPGALKNPYAVVGDLMNDIPQQWGPVGTQWGQRRDKLRSARAKLSQ